MTKQQLEMCISEYGKDIYSFCRQLTGSRQEADDLYQDTFLKAVELREKMDYGQNPKSYLLSVALRIWKNKKRKSAWRRRIADVRPAADARETDIAAGEEASPEQQAICRERDAAVRLAVNRLPEKLKVTTLLFYMEGLSTAQIAQAMQVPKGTVMSRLYQARKRLQKELEDVLDE